MNTHENYILNKDPTTFEYSGGYSVQSLLTQNQNNENKQTGGNKHVMFSQFQDMVIPIGLVLENRCNMVTQKMMDVFDDKYEHKNIEDDMFDKLLYSMNSLVAEKGSKTEKHRNPSSKKTMKK